MTKKSFGILMILGGLALIGLSVYIKYEVEHGKMQISSAEEKVSQGKSLFSTSPATKMVGNIFTGSAENEISEGKLKISQYEQISLWCLIGGIAFAIIGGALVFSGKKRGTPNG